MMRILSSPLVILGILIAQPIVNFIAHNSGDEAASVIRSVGYFGILYLVGLITIYLLHRLTQKRVSLMTLSLVLGGGVLFVFNSYHIDFMLMEKLGDGYRFRYFLMVFGACLIGLVLLLPKILNTPKKKEFLAFFIVALISSDVFILAKSFYGSSEELSVKHHADLQLDIQPVTHSGYRPNVYMIIPDQFIGAESYHQISGNHLKITPWLKQKNFYVVENAHSNAPYTRASLPLVFSMQYILEDKQTIGTRSIRNISEVYYRGQNPVIKGFKERGYRYIRFADGYVGFCDSQEDLCITNRGIFTLQDVMFLERARLLKFASFAKMALTNKPILPNTMEPGEFFEHLPQVDEGPYFLLFHLSMPHAPIRYDEHCQYQDTTQGEFLAINNNFLDISTSIEEHWPYYDGQLKCTERFLQRYVDKILERDPDALIVIQSDHGTDFSNQWFTEPDQFTEDQYEENFNILSAYHMPENCQAYLKSNYSPINTFRHVFSCIDKTEPELLPHRSFIVNFHSPSVMASQSTQVVEWPYHKEPQDVS